VPIAPEEGKAHLAEMQQYQLIFWNIGSEDDEVRKKLAAIQERLDTLVKPYFQEPMRTYSVLTKPWN
jgi:hypothetical protein